VTAVPFSQFPLVCYQETKYTSKWRD